MSAAAGAAYLRVGGPLARLRRDRGTLAAAVALIALVLFCVAGPWLAGALGLDGTTMRFELGSAPPSRAHWFGTDPQGRDLLVRVMLGGRVALAVAAITTVLAVGVGVAFGAVAAYAGGVVDYAMMRLVDALYGLPTVALVIVVMALRDSRSLSLLVAILAAVSWLTLARVVRAQVRSLRDREFVEAARGLGASAPRVVLRHILPNLAGLVVVYATLALPQVMLAEAFLSFLGLGVQAPLASLGTLVTEGSAQILVAPWMLACPGLLMAALVWTLNFLGDGLRDALTPTSAR
ncbi:MAG: ABC transporter permease [Kofleriaceae bacterium]